MYALSLASGSAASGSTGATRPRRAGRDQTASLSLTAGCTGRRQPRRLRSMPPPASRSGSTHTSSAAARGRSGSSPKSRTGCVYLASQYGSGPGGGVLIALNASTGAVLWKFNTVVGAAPRRAVARSSARAALGRRRSSAATGRLPTESAIHTRSPASAIAHPSAQLYTDSDVNLDAATGKLRWYYQGVPNDFKDYDMQASPIAARVNGVRWSSVAARWATSTR